MLFISYLGPSTYIELDHGNDAHKLMSPGYPCGYPLNVDRLWIITGLPQHIVVIYILDFKLTGAGVSYFKDFFDYVTFGRGQSTIVESSVIAEITATTKIRSVTSYSPAMWIRLNTHLTSVPERGFYFEITQFVNQSGNVECHENDILNQQQTI